jgi:hypothetical protein
MAELALAWVLRRPEVASAIVGASRPEQVHANAKASGIQLTPDTLAAIEEALGDTSVKQPTLAPLRRPGVTHRRTGELEAAPGPSVAVPPRPDTGNSGSICALPDPSTHPTNHNQAAAGRPAQRRTR